jgi:hypothetical protein
MHLPEQSPPIPRNLDSTQSYTSCEAHADAWISQHLSRQPGGVHASGYEDCYRLTGPAQRTCLLMSTY